MKNNTLLWIVQGLLAAMFLLAGVPKLVMSAQQVAAPGPIQLSVGFIRFIGVCEILGAIGMILPGVTGIGPGLTPVGAGGLLIIMSGATVINLIDGATALALFTAILGALAGLVAYGRWTRAQRARASAKA